MWWCVALYPVIAASAGVVSLKEVLVMLRTFILVNPSREATKGRMCHLQVFSKLVESVQQAPPDAVSHHACPDNVIAIMY